MHSSMHGEFVCAACLTLLTLLFDVVACLLLVGCFTHASCSHIHACMHSKHAAACMQVDGGSSAVHNIEVAAAAKNHLHWN